MHFGRLLTLCSIASNAAAVVIGGERLRIRDSDGLQSIVTWDEQSIFVHGQRVLFYSGSFHPFRLPVPGLWLDVFQKIKALGYTGVTFYIDWALLEGDPGHFLAEGIFSLEPFFAAAQSAGIYLLARPGPYINAEASGGGFPGWLQRNPAVLRTDQPGYIDATQLYVNSVSQIVAKAQITNGGPVILFQPENEYTEGDEPYFPSVPYFEKVEQQYRSNGIVVPLISNDAYPAGNFAPGPPRSPGAVDIYGFDGYPLGFDCANPSVWPNGDLPTDWYQLHEQQSSSTPLSIVEFQGGSFDPWGGTGFEKCAELLGADFESVFYKNNIAFGVRIFNIYMTYGGSNWGNLGHPGGYSSYDYGAVIKEDRTVARDKYGEAKLIANFLQASAPEYLTAIPQNDGFTVTNYTSNANVVTTALFGAKTKFFVVRHAAYNSESSDNYQFTFPTSKGKITVPQLGGQLTLNGRDSKIFVTDYNIANVDLLYSTAEVFTAKQYGNSRVLVLYTGPNETNEFAVMGGPAVVTEGSGIRMGFKNGATVLNFETSSDRRIVDFAFGLRVYILDRLSAYDYWVVNYGTYSNVANGLSTPIVRTKYLLRSITASNGVINVVGDLNQTSELEVIGAPDLSWSLSYNGQKQQRTFGPGCAFKLPFQWTPNVLCATVTYHAPQVSLPDLSTITWKKLDTLPEIQPGYDDSAWTKADLTTSNNTAANLTTPTSLFASDYGYLTGYLIYRGHFTSNGKEKSIYLSTQGGDAFGHSVWLNGTFLGSWIGDPNDENYNQTLNIPNALTAGKQYVFTVLIDQMGMDEGYSVMNPNEMKTPRGILDYVLDGQNQSAVTWKLTGNLGGEQYYDKTRGPLNEGGLYAERQGYYLPGAPISGWTSVTGGPNTGLTQAGVNFYAVNVNLNLPRGYDIPLSITLDMEGSTAYRCQIYVNGYQFGKYINNIGPQVAFPVPPGIFNPNGNNYIAVTLWALDAGGAQTSNIQLVSTALIQSGYGPVTLSPMTGWTKRPGAY